MKSKSKNVKIAVFLASLISVMSSSIIWNSATGPSGGAGKDDLKGPSAGYSRDDLDKMCSELDSIVKKVENDNTPDLISKLRMDKAKKLFNQLKALNQRCNQLEDAFNTEVSKYETIKHELVKVDAQCQKAEKESLLAEKKFNDHLSTKTASQRKLNNKLKQEMDQKKEVLKTVLENLSALKAEEKLCESNIDNQWKEMDKIQQEMSLVTKKINELVNSGIKVGIKIPIQ